MKKICIVLFMIPVFANAQINFTDIDGKWQEEKRTLKKNKEIDFTDTLRMEIRKDGFVMIRHDKGPTITGEAEIRGKKLVLNDNKYGLVETGKNKLILNDDDGNHHFNKVEEFNSSPVQRKIPGVEEGKKDIALGTIKGKWTCYKKTDPAFNQGKFYLKAIDFKEDKGNGTYAGVASFSSSDSVYSTEAFIYIKGTDLVISTDEETFKAKVMKSDGQEMILQNGVINYFMKQFGKKD